MSNQLHQTDVHLLAVRKGFYEMRSKLMLHLHETHADEAVVSFVNAMWTATRLALIHAEVSEALECVARDNHQALPAELADIQLRLMDLSANLGIDLDAAAAAKHAYNEGRPIRHGGKCL